ncbi:MAG: succinate dehydrogenase [Pseudomonadota bacterium]
MTSGLYLAQRMSAVILAPLVLVHLIIIIYATQNGLSAAEILGRTQGSVFWTFFYGLFVVAAAIHGTIGLRTIMAELTNLPPRSVDGIAAAFGLFALVLGFRAVAAVT